MIDIRLSGEQAPFDRMLKLLRALEHFQHTGEIQEVLRNQKLRVLDAGLHRQNRNNSRIYRQYIKVAIDEHR